MKSRRVDESEKNGGRGPHINMLTCPRASCGLDFQHGARDTSALVVIDQDPRAPQPSKPELMPGEEMRRDVIEMGSSITLYQETLGLETPRQPITESLAPRGQRGPSVYILQSWRLQGLLTLDGPEGSGVPLRPNMSGGPLV
ncbi:unnamed protein product [Lota lota]